MGEITLYRLRLQPRGATLSPWQADTLFGHLCWQAYFRDGPSGLQEFLAPFRAGKPPFVISDGFPYDHFPRPLVARPLVSGSKSRRVAAMDKNKREKRVTLLTQAQFERALTGEPVEMDGPEKEPAFVRASDNVLKNQINRLTGTTTAAQDDDETGNLYAVDELAYYRREAKTRQSVPITLYLWAQDEDKAKDAEDRFRQVAEGGYGKKKSTGYGNFVVLGRERFTLTYPDRANGLVVLANFVPAASDPVDGASYKTHVKYGKLGEAGILNGAALSPFKRPLVMLTAGSTFRSRTLPPYLGRLVEGIHPEDATIVQGAFAPAVPIHLPDQET